MGGGTPVPTNTNQHMQPLVCSGIYPERMYKQNLCGQSDPLSGRALVHI
jgi:hypothetical protein